MNNPELFDVNVELFTVTEKSKFYHHRVILLPLEKEMVLWSAVVVSRTSRVSAKEPEDQSLRKTD